MMAYVLDRLRLRVRVLFRAGRVEQRFVCSFIRRTIDTESSRTWDGRMKVDVFDATCRLSREPRSIEVIDVRYPCVENVERLHHKPSLPGHRDTRSRHSRVWCSST